MATYRCPVCGAVHSDGCIPDEALSYLIMDTKTEDLVERIDKLGIEHEEQRRTNIDFLITSAGHEVYRCSQCGTLVVDGDSEWSGVYRPVSR